MVQPDLFDLSWRLWGRLAAGDGAVVEKGLEQRADQLPHTLPDGSREPRSARMATALTSIAQDALDGHLAEDGQPRTGGGPELTIFVDGDLADETNGEAGDEVASGPRVGPQTLEEILCVGRVGVLRHLPNGDPIRVGDHRAAIPPSVRRYVFYRHGGVCSVDGCGSRYRLQPRHQQPRAHGGDNHPDNLPLLCCRCSFLRPPHPTTATEERTTSFHHHRVIHQLGYSIDPRSPVGRVRLLPPERDPP